MKMTMARRPTREELEEQNRRFDERLRRLTEWNLFWPW